MLCIIELILLAAGLWAMIRGRIPSFLIGGPEYVLEGSGARILGLLLVLPFPLSVLVVVLLGLVFDMEASRFSLTVEILNLVLVAIIVFVGARLIRKPRSIEGGIADDPAAELERVIARKSTGSFIYAILGLLGFAGIVLGPLAYYRAGQALRLMETHGIGHQFRSKARDARILAAMASAIWGLALLGILTLIIPGFFM
jgi:hypothetical protein